MELKPTVLRFVGFALAVVCPSVTHADWTYTTDDIPGQRATRLWSISARGDTAVGHYQDPDLVIHGFIQFSDGSIQTLDVPFPDATGTQTVARGINGQGYVVGRYLTPDGTERGWLYDGNSYTRIEVPDSTQTYTHGINDDGVIVGKYFSGAQQHGYFLEGNRFTSFDVPDSLRTGIAGINNNGDIVGNFTSQDNVQHGFVRYADGTIETIDFPQAALTAANGINTCGAIVGQMQTADGIAHGYLFSNGMFTQFDFPDPKVRDTMTPGIADTDEIVGFYNFNGSLDVHHGLRLTKGNQ